MNTPEDKKPFPCPDPELAADCSGCTDPQTEGTHQGCTKQHGHVGCDKAIAKSSFQRGWGNGPVSGPKEPEASDSDDLYADAVQVVREANKASASLLQRRLQIGYARAARLLDLMEQNGVIGEADGAKPREVFPEGFEKPKPPIVAEESPKENPAQPLPSKPEAPKHPGGRPTDFTEELGKEICVRLADGESLREICKSEDMPARRTVHYWLIEGAGEDTESPKAKFLRQYNNARNIQAENLFEETLELADEAHEDIVGDDKSDSARVNARKLQVDTRKWFISKVIPKKFGDKLDLTSDGEKLPTPILGGLSRKDPADVAAGEKDIEKENGQADDLGEG